MAFALRAFFLLCGIIGLVTAYTPHKSEGTDYCPKGWTQLGCRCFIFQDYAREFTDAESICKILGGNLASFSSALEYAVIRELILEKSSDTSVDVWIGLHQALEADHFVWTDGSKVGFTAFNEDGNNSGNCVEIENEDLLWDIDLCSRSNKFVCARDAEKCCADH
ncbi:dromaiocalcin-1-like [Vanacampus margaritifer]